MALVAVGLICIAILLVQAPLNRGQGNICYASNL